MKESIIILLIVFQMKYWPKKTRHIFFRFWHSWWCNWLYRRWFEPRVKNIFLNADFFVWIFFVDFFEFWKKTIISFMKASSVSSQSLILLQMKTRKIFSRFWHSWWHNYGASLASDIRATCENIWMNFDFFFLNFNKHLLYYIILFPGH